MSSLIKYEFKKSLKTYVFGLSIVLALYIYLLSRINFIDFNDNSFNKFENILTVIPMTTYMGILGIGTIVLVITSIMSLFDDLYKDTAYLLLSVPKTGYEIIGSKLIVAAIKMAIWILVMFLTGVHIISSGIAKAQSNFDFIGLIQDNMTIVGLMFFSILAAFISFLILIYFSLVFNKSILADVKFNVVLSIVLFFILGNIIGRITNMIAGAGNMIINIPVNLDKVQYIMGMDNFQIPPPIPGTYSLDILPIIISTAIYGTLYVVTSQLIERKVNI